VNTHYHGDHTDGTGSLGKDAVIIMHPNCKASLAKTMKAKGGEKEYLAKIKTWTKDMVLQLGGETVKLLHFGNGHSSGDLVVVFEKAKVFHTGDLFFHQMPPYIDVADGADTGNWIHTIQTLCKEYPDFKIIPGHGSVTTPGEYLKMAGYLTYLRNQVAAAIKAGKTREQARESIDLEPYKWMPDTSEYTDKRNNIGWIYDEMTRKKE
jgi:glyoxylase-like metal-dependent hydrolase (beta-lactamase superfamily II)